jgi:hypothetical protein
VLRGESFTSATVDGGATWDNANEVGFRINRFRFVGDPLQVGYASGETVYKFTDQPDDAMLPAAMESDKARADIEGDVAVSIVFAVRGGIRDLRVDLWERFGRHVVTLLQESSPALGQRTVEWDFLDSSGRLVPIGAYVLRVTTDDISWSAIVHRRQIITQSNYIVGAKAESLFRSRKDWHAICRVDHPYWTRPVIHTPHQANRDAHTHDISSHGGERTAVVISEP